MSKAKLRYYKSKVENTKHYDQSKWYKAVYKLAVAEELGGVTPLPENVTDITERLQSAFIKSWKDIEPTEVPDVDDVVSLLRDNIPATPSIGQIKSSLKHLNSRKATGADEIPAWLLKRFHEELAPVVHDIICCSIKECKFSVSYKHALITFPKVSCPKDIENDFRQVSILPHTAKLLEKHQLLLNKSDILLNNTQHGFTEGRSTVSALSFVSQNWYNATDNSKDGRSGVHALFLDFRKAFDLVDHGILPWKLAELNLNKSFWLWIKSFLEGRSQQVRLDNIKPRSESCPAGVPQGSVISPILFNVHINNLEDSVPSHLKISSCKYADDCTQYEIIQRDGYSNLQESLDAVNDWAVSNKMQLDPKKTKDMWICFRNDIEPPPLLTLGNDIIERVTSFKLLGVWHQNNLKWLRHVEEISKERIKDFII